MRRPSRRRAGPAWCPAAAAAVLSGSSAASAQGIGPGLSKRLASRCSRSSSVAASSAVGMPRRGSGGRRSPARSRSSLPPSRKRPQGQGPGAFQEDRLVQRRQRLERRVRPRPADAGEVAVGGVERLEHRVRHRAIAERVKRPAVTVGAVRFVPDLGAVAGRRLEQETRRRREDARAADLRDRAGRWPPGRCRARSLGVDAEPRAAGQQAVVRDRGPASSRVVDPRRLAVGRRVDDQPMQVLEAPAVVHELDGQPVEQLGMRRRLALRAEVLAGRDDAGAEVRLPDAVDQRSRRGRRPAVDQPARRTSAASARAPAGNGLGTRDARLDRRSPA